VNAFSLNAASLDGSNQIWSWYGDANIVFQADGDVALGLVASGSADVVLQADLLPRLNVSASGSADVVFVLDGDLLYGRTASGDMQLVLTADGDGTRWTFGASDLTAVFQADGDAQVVSQVSSNFNIQFDALLDGRAATVQQGIADFSVVFDAQLDYRVARPAFLEGDAPLVFGMDAMPFMRINSVSGAADIAWQAGVDTRLGGRLYGEGSADIALIATGYALQWHYLYAEADVQVRFTAVAERHGLPVIPSIFIAAPPVRLLYLGAEHRAFIVPAERRA
jgi:hypothetical protein